MIRFAGSYITDTPNAYAEGVETAEAWNILGELGCDMAQGYYVSPPLPPREFEAWFQKYGVRGSENLFSLRQ